MNFQSNINHENNNSKTKAFIYILILLLIVIGTLFTLEVTGYSLFNKNNEEESKNANDGNKVIIGEYMTSSLTVVLYKGEVYVNIGECGFSSDIYCKTVSNMSELYKTFDIGVCQNMYFNGKFYGLKLNVDDVKDIYVILYDQAEQPYQNGIGLIKNDGTLSLITFQSIILNKLIPKNASGLTNIVKLENKLYDHDVSLGYEYVAVDINGKAYDIQSYMKEENLLIQ